MKPHLDLLVSATVKRYMPAEPGTCRVKRVCFYVVFARRTFRQAPFSANSQRAKDRASCSVEERSEEKEEKELKKILVVYTRSEHAHDFISKKKYHHISTPRPSGWGRFWRLPGFQILKHHQTRHPKQFRCCPVLSWSCAKAIWCRREAPRWHEAKEKNTTGRSVSSIGSVVASRFFLLRSKIPSKKTKHIRFLSPSLLNKNCKKRKKTPAQSSSLRYFCLIESSLQMGLAWLHWMAKGLKKRVPKKKVYQGLQRCHVFWEPLKFFKTSKKHSFVTPGIISLGLHFCGQAGGFVVTQPSLWTL